MLLVCVNPSDSAYARVEMGAEAGVGVVLPDRSSISATNKKGGLGISDVPSPVAISQSPPSSIPQIQKGAPTPTLPSPSTSPSPSAISINGWNLFKRMDNIFQRMDAVESSIIELKADVRDIKSSGLVVVFVGFLFAVLKDIAMLNRMDKKEKEMLDRMDRKEIKAQERADKDKKEMADRMNIMFAIPVVISVIALYNK
jgi:hypothetical protein